MSGENQLLQLLSPLQQQHFQHRPHHQQESHQLQQKPPKHQQHHQQQQQLTQFKLSYVDFPPRCAGAGSVICSPDYERFDSLLRKANEWLRNHSTLKVKTCESVEVKGRYDGVVDTNKSCFFEADHSKRRMRNLFVRVLRLWVVQKEPTDPIEPQQVGYVNVVPTRNDLGAFENFGDTVRKFNNHLKNKPLPGRILNVETQEMKFHEWGVGVDPDESCWVESVKFNISFLVVIRVFFELGVTAYEEIGCADFVPNNLDQGSQFSVPSFETFEQVFMKASSWIRHQNNVRVTNLQSIDYKMKNDFDTSELDTQRSFFVESGRYTTKYLRILRVCFTRSFIPLKQQPQLIQESQQQPQQQQQQSSVIKTPQHHHRLQRQHSLHSPSSASSLTSTPKGLQCRYVTFEPMMLSSGGIIGIPLFERLSETMKRAMTWLNKTNPDLKLLSAETVPVRMFSGNQYGNHEVTYTWNRGEQKEFWLLVIRLYLTGVIDVTPPDIIMPAFLDKKHHDDCCDVM